MSKDSRIRICILNAVLVLPIIRNHFMEQCRMDAERKYDLEDRLVDYAARIMKLSESLPNSKSGKHIATQILRSGTAAAPNYGEAQSAESRADFVHKLKIALKELRETRVWLKIITKTQLVKPDTLLTPLLKETDELIAILFACVTTAKQQAV